MKKNINNFKERSNNRKNKVSDNMSNMIESEYYTEITYQCPIRGKVTEMVKVTRIKPQKMPDKVFEFDYEFLKDAEMLEDDDTIG